MPESFGIAFLGTHAPGMSRPVIGVGSPLTTAIATDAGVVGGARPPATYAAVAARRLAMTRSARKVEALITRTSRRETPPLNGFAASSPRGRRAGVGAPSRRAPPSRPGRAR